MGLLLCVEAIKPLLFRVTVRPGKHLRRKKAEKGGFSLYRRQRAAR
jgi:hypothetical protein